MQGPRARVHTHTYTHTVMCQQSVCIFISGLYPQIGWRVGDEVVFVMEGASHDTGSLVKWAEQIGMIIIHCHTIALISYNSKVLCI